jgi:hypothetical protein
MIMFVEKLPTYGFEDLGKEVKVPTIGTLRVTMDQRQGTHQGEVG